MPGAGEATDGESAGQPYVGIYFYIKLDRGGLLKTLVMHA